MTLTITQPYEQLKVENIIVYFYGLPSMRKSALGMTARKAILINFDKGAHRVDTELRRCPVLDIDSWRDIQNAQKSLFDPFETIVIDTAGTMQECARLFVAEDSKNTYNGVLKQNAQGIANSHINSFIRKLKSWKKDIVFIAHAVEDKNNQDRSIVRPDLGGRLRQDLYRQADCMAFLNFDIRPNCLQHVLRFTANDEFLAKDCAGLGMTDIPDLRQAPTFLGDLMQYIKNKINSLTPEQLAEMKILQEFSHWESQCSDARSAKDFNTLTLEIINLFQSNEVNEPQYKTMWKTLKNYATDLGFIYDKDQTVWLESQ